MDPALTMEAELRLRPIRELRAGLTRLGYPVAHCVERSDFISALLEASASQLRAALGKSKNADGVDGQAELVRQLLAGRPETAVSEEASEDRLPPGSIVRLFNLQSAPALNMQRAVVVRHDSTSDRYEVRLDWDGSIKKVRYDNLEMQETTSPPSPLVSKASIPSPRLREKEVVEADAPVSPPRTTTPLVGNLGSRSPSRSSVDGTSMYVLDAAISPNTKNVSTISRSLAASNADVSLSTGASTLDKEGSIERENGTASTIDILPSTAENTLDMGVSFAQESSIASHDNILPSIAENALDKVGPADKESAASTSDILPSIVENALDTEGSVEQESCCRDDLAAQIGELLIAAAVLDEPFSTPEEPERTSEDVEHSQESLLSISSAVEQSAGPLILPTPTSSMCSKVLQDDADGKAESYCSSPRSSADLRAVRTDSCLVDDPPLAEEPEVSKAAPLIFEMKPGKCSDAEQHVGKNGASKKALRIRVAYDAGKQNGENATISYLSEALRKLWKAGDLCDVTLFCCGSAFRVHRLVLAAQSQELKDLVAETADVQMSWLAYPESLKLMLDFLYEEDTIWSYLPSCHEVNMEVMQLAHKFQLPRLMHRAAAIMAQGLSTDNVVQSLHDCGTFRLGELKDRILSHIASNKKALAEITTGSNISSHPDLLREILVRLATPKDEGPRKRARLST